MSRRATTEAAMATRPATSTSDERAWCAQAVRALRDEAATGGDTPMLELPLPGFPGVRFLLKDESVHPTGSLKHRLARSLFLYALCSGRLRRGQMAVDASSGSTAISEAWFARLLGVPFVAVMPRTTARAKQDEVAALGGRCVPVAPDVDTAAYARALAAEHGACYLDQFGLAGSATDWRGNNNIAQSLLEQCRQSGAPEPTWIVCGAGTGGTSATIGRYLRYRGLGTSLCIAEPSGAAFALGWQRGDRTACAQKPTLIEGIGRGRVEPCFAFELADEVIEVPDAASVAGIWLLETWMGRRFGGSSGTNLVAALQLAERLSARGETGAIVLLLCDRGERYADTLFAPDWLAMHDLPLAPWLQRLRALAHHGAADAGHAATP